MDYAAIDFTENARVTKIIIPPEKVIDQDSMDVSDLLKSDDRQYLIQKEIGEEAVMDFTLPDYFNPTVTIFRRTGKSELAFVWSFLKPGRLSEYSYEMHLKLQELLAKNE